MALLCWAALVVLWAVNFIQGDKVAADTYVAAVVVAALINLKDRRK